MTVDDLRNLYNRAFSRVPEAEGLLAQQNAGIEAVVRALRDEMRFWCTGCDCCYRNENAWDEILGDAGEKAAGGPTSNDGPGVIAPLASPAADLSVGQRLVKAAKEAAAIARGEAADPSPAVCEWTRADKSKLLGVQWWNVGCVSGLKRDGTQSSCPSCGKPISFVEAS